MDFNGVVAIVAARFLNCASPGFVGQDDGAFIERIFVVVGDGLPRVFQGGFVSRRVAAKQPKKCGGNDALNSPAATGPG